MSGSETREIKCACPQWLDAHDCIRSRYKRPIDEPVDDPCECACHTEQQQDEMEWL